MIDEAEFLADMQRAQTLLSQATNELNRLNQSAKAIVEMKRITKSKEREILASEVSFADPMFGWMPARLYCSYTGYSEDAMRKKTARSEFLEGVHYFKADFDRKLWYNYPAIARLARDGA